MRPLALALLLAATLSAHRLDEYLQATLISIHPARIEIEISLTPGIAVAPVILARIDTNGDGVISTAEQHLYLRRALQAMTLESDGAELAMSLDESSFPAIDLIREGLGTIRLRATAGLPFSWQSKHTLSFANRHSPANAAYLVNCLAPQSPGIAIQQQTRDYLQSQIQVTYFSPRHLPSPWWLAVAALVAMWIPSIRSALQSR